MRRRTVGPTDGRTVTRREALAASAGAVTAAILPSFSAPTVRPPDSPTGRLKQSACRWPYRAIPLPDLCRAAAQAHDAGLQFAYHNHDFEFVPTEGRLPYDVLLETTDPKLVQFEMDLYWITKGGQDPLTYFARWPGRIPLVHVKDSGGPPDHKMMDVGAGTIDWKKIFAREDQAGIRHAFVEHDQPADAFASIKASCDYLKRPEF